MLMNKLMTGSLFATEREMHHSGFFLFFFKLLPLPLPLVLVTIAANLAGDPEIRIASALFLECTSTTMTTHHLTVAPRLGHVQSLRPQSLYWSGKEFHARRRRGQILGEVRDEERLGRF
jgi:hypothetical protein